MANVMILVAGATGTVGSELIKQLVGARQKVRVLVRDPAKAAIQLTALKRLGTPEEVAHG